MKQFCDHPDCGRPGVHRAPKSPFLLTEYYWFCLEHVRDYNKSWNYCVGMSQRDIEQRVREDVTWNRPTWPLGMWRTQENRLRERIHRDFASAAPFSKARSDQSSTSSEPNDPAKRQTEQIIEAFLALDLHPPVEFSQIKARYRILVKTHHPDANGGDRQAEERLKQINSAYTTLKTIYAQCQGDDGFSYH
ncbi:J domain-containing protein [Azospirillaceae bacterium]